MALSVYSPHATQMSDVIRRITPPTTVEPAPSLLIISSNYFKEHTTYVVVFGNDVIVAAMSDQPRLQTWFSP